MIFSMRMKVKIIVRSSFKIRSSYPFSISLTEFLQWPGTKVLGLDAKNSQFEACLLWLEIPYCKEYE